MLPSFKLTLLQAAPYNFSKFGALDASAGNPRPYNYPTMPPVAGEIMSIRERLEEDIRNAMRSRSQQRLEALRFLKSAINRVEIDRRVTLDDDGITEVVVRQVKDRRDSIRMFQEGNRQDLVEKETADLAILEEYMPPQLEEAELVALIEQTIKQVGAETIRDKGKVMGRLMPQVQGKADGQQVNAIVTRLLEG